MVRSKSLIDSLFGIGLCIPYKRILHLTHSIYEQLQINYNYYGIHLPNNLRKDCFVILAKDNIDKNAKSNFLLSHFHGTSLSVLQPMEAENENKSK